jgi:hypothetical protein
VLGLLRRIRADATTRRLLVVSLLAFGLALAYGVYLQPEWESYRDDQRQYLLLARGIATRGEFTRAPAGEPFVPEPLRTPGYPLMLAPLCATVGCDHAQVAVAQAIAAAALPLLVFALVRRFAPDLALPAAVATAVYLPFAYYAALALADFAATLVLALALVLVARARSLAGALVAGVALGFLALVRAQFVLLPLALAAALIVARDGRAAWPRRAPRAAALILGAVLTLVPFNLYSYAYFGSPFVSSSGTGLWWGYFQGRGADARGIGEFRDLALRGASDDAIASAGAAIGLDPLESREAAGAYRDIAAFDAIGDRTAQAYGWIAFNRSMTARALALIAHDPLAYVARGFGVRTIELWAGDVPMRVRDFQELPAAPRIVAVAAQLVLFAFALAGAVLLARRGGREPLLVAATLLYSWLALIIFVTEAHYSLPARTVLLIASLYAVTALARRGVTFRARAPSKSAA